jgi:hypothetical protein
MPSHPKESHVARWITPDPEAVSNIVAAVLREEAWWTALRSGKYAHTSVVWADGAMSEERSSVEPLAIPDSADLPADLDVKT